MCIYVICIHIYFYVLYVICICFIWNIYVLSEYIYIIYIWKYIFYIFYTSCQLFSLSRTPILGDKRLGAHVIEEPTAPVVLIMWEHVSQLQNIWADFPNSDAREFPDDKIQHAWIRFIRQDSGVQWMMWGYPGWSESIQRREGDAGIKFKYSTHSWEEGLALSCLLRKATWAPVWRKYDK